MAILYGTSSLCVNECKKSLIKLRNAANLWEFFSTIGWNNNMLWHIYSQNFGFRKLLVWELYQFEIILLSILLDFFNLKFSILYSGSNGLAIVDYPIYDPNYDNIKH